MPSTNVANGCKEPIYAKVTHEGINKTFCVDVVGKVGFETNEEPLGRDHIPDGYVKINPNQFFRFDVNSDTLRRKVTHFSVRFEDEREEPLSGQVQTNHSIIVKEDKTIANAMYSSRMNPFGKSEIWQDTAGLWHGPEIHRNEAPGSETNAGKADPESNAEAKDGLESHADAKVSLEDHVQARTDENKDVVEFQEEIDDDDEPRADSDAGAEDNVDGGAQEKSRKEVIA